MTDHSISNPSCSNTPSPFTEYVQRFATKEAVDAVSKDGAADDEDEVMSDVGSISDDD